MQAAIVHMFGRLGLRTNSEILGVYMNFLLMFIQSNIYRLTIDAARFNISSEDFGPSKVRASCRVREVREIEFENQSVNDWCIH